MKSTVNYFWVNQGKTYSEERSLECLWAPLFDTGGNTPYHWKTMEKVKPGDVILNYCGHQGGLLGYCEARSDAFSHAQPDFDYSSWEKDGLMIDAEYHQFPNPISKGAFLNEIMELLPVKYSPINSSGNANQGYLYQISGDLFSKVIELSGIDWSDKIDNLEAKVYSKTEKLGVSSRRITQPQFRMSLIKKWRGKCSVTGCSELGVLVASHIVPWRHATNSERNDPDNGLLLSPVYDKLFDREFITFDESGKIVLGKTISKVDFKKLGVTGEEQINGLSEGNKLYLSRHNKLLK